MWVNEPAHVKGFATLCSITVTLLSDGACRWGPVVFRAREGDLGMQEGQASATANKNRIFGRFVWEDLLLAVVLLVIGIFGVYRCLQLPSPLMIAYLVFSVAFAVSIWALARFGKHRGDTFFAHKVFPVFFGLVAILGLVFFPPCTIPDEHYHFIKSYVVANLLTPGMDEHDMRAEDVALLRDKELYDHVITTSYWDKVPQISLLATNEGVDKEFMQKSDWGFDPSLDISVDLPQLKIPSALGIIVGRALGLSGVFTYYLGRLFNALYAVALIVLAVRMAPVGKNALMAAAMLPMTLHLIGSYSYDAGYIALAFLTMGLLLRMLCDEKPISPQLMAGFLITGMLLTPGKLIYSLVAFCGLVVPADRFSSKRTALAFKVGVVLIPLAAILIFNGARVLAVLGIAKPTSAVEAGDGLDHRGADTGTFYTIGAIVSDPLHSLKFLYVTLRGNMRFYITSMLGGSLGWLQANLIAPLWEDGWMLAALLFGLFRSKDDEGVLDRVPRITLCLAAMLGAGAVILTMWLSWTLQTDTVINGVQGRYMLPLLPALMMGIRPKRIQIPVRMAPSILLALSSFACFYWTQIYYVANTAAVAAV